MKKLLLLVLALLPLLASCGGNDDDNNNGGGSSSTSIEGVWFEKSEYTYNWDYATDKPDMSKVKHTYIYDDYDERYIHTITKNGNVYTDKYTDGYDDWYGIFEYSLISGNEYDIIEVHKSDNRKEKVGKLTIKSVTEKQMVWEAAWNYDGDKDFSVITLMR